MPTSSPSTNSPTSDTVTVESYIKCDCSPVKYLYTVANQIEHFNSEFHQNLIKTNLYQTITIICPCGENYDYQTQLTHVETASHVKWEVNQNPQNKAGLPIICECSFVLPLKFLSEHQQSSIHHQLESKVSFLI